MAEAAVRCGLLPGLICGLVLLSLLALVPLAGAIYSFDGVPYSDRLDLVAHGTLRGGVYVGESRGLDFPPYEQHYQLPAGIEVKWARLYVGIWGGTERYEGWVQTTFNGHDLGKTALRGLNDENPHVYCSSHGVYWVYYDVTNMVVPGQNMGVADTSRGERGSKLDGRVYGIILVAVYAADDAPETSYWVCDGDPSLHGKGWVGAIPSINDLVSVDFSGELNPANVNAGRVTVVYLAGNLGEPDYLEFNGHEIGGNDVANNEDGKTYGIDLKSFDVTQYTQAENQLHFLRGKDLNGDSMIETDDEGNLEGEYYMHPVLAVLAVEHKNAEHTTPDFVVTLDLANLTEGANTLHAVVSNDGRLYEDDVRLSVFVDDSEIYADAVRMDASGVKSVSVPWTAAPGMHTLTAQVDPENVVEESNEQNNVFRSNIHIGGSPDVSVRILTPVREQNGATTARGIVTVGAGLIGALLVFVLLLRRRDTRKRPIMSMVLLLVAVLSVALVTCGCVNKQSGGEEPVGGGMLTYSVPVEVTNEGEMPAADFALALYIDGEKSAITTIERLEGGASFTANFPIAVTEGTHTLKAVADERNELQETRRENNIDEIRFEF
jgi:subtilase family serine protease